MNFKPRFLFPYVLVLVKMLQNLGSSNRAIRRMSTVFFLSLFGLLSVSVALTVHLFQRDQEVSLRKQEEQKQKEAHQRQMEMLRQEASVFVSLGSLLIDLKSTPELKSVGRIKNLAQIEVHFHCDSSKTKTLILERVPELKDMILTVLIGVDREELQSHLGKKRLRSLILQKVNAWLPFGKVDDVLLSNILFV